jgi:CRP-like cAMP-binding protein
MAMDAQAVTGAARIPLLEVVPSLVEHLPRDGQELARRLTLRVPTLTPGERELDQLLTEPDAFAAVLVDGILMHRIAIGEQPALRLLGPGDILTRLDESRPFLLTRSTYRAAAPARLALLDDRVLWLAQRFPRLFAGLQARIGAQQDRIAAQLAACQLPRVEDRLIAIMWLIAERWGRVTSAGTVVPVSLTHDALGELIGARRSTVSLALKQLVADGVIARNDGGWLLLGPPPEVAPAKPLSVAPELIRRGDSDWAPPASRPPAVDPQQLSALVHAMAQSHEHNAATFQKQIDRSRQARDRSRALRDLIATQQPHRRPAP